MQQLNNLHPEEQLQSVLNDQNAKDLAASLTSILEGCNLKPLTELICMMLRLNPHERISLEEVNVRLSYLHSKLT